jgi:hypothetical protein
MIFITQFLKSNKLYTYVYIIYIQGQSAPPPQRKIVGALLEECWTSD